VEPSQARLANFPRHLKGLKSSFHARARKASTSRLLIFWPSYLIAELRPCPGVWGTVRQPAGLRAGLGGCHLSNQPHAALLRPPRPAPRRSDQVRLRSADTGKTYTYAGTWWPPRAPKGCARSLGHTNRTARSGPTLRASMIASVWAGQSVAFPVRANVSKITEVREDARGAAARLARLTTWPSFFRLVPFEVRLVLAHAWMEPVRAAQALEAGRDVTVVAAGETSATGPTSGNGLRASRSSLRSRHGDSRNPTPQQGICWPRR